MCFGGGGGKDYTGEQFKYDKAVWRYNYEDMMDRNAFAQESHDIQVWNRNQQLEFQNKNRTIEWQHKNDMRIFDFNNQMNAYNASIEAFDQQLDYNDLAAEISLGDNTRKFNEQLTEIGFKNEDLLDQLNWQTREMTQNLQANTAELATKAEGAKLESLQAAGKVRASGQTGRSARKGLQSVLAEAGTANKAIMDMYAKQEMSYGLQVDKSFKQATFNQRQLAESMKSASSQFESDLQHTQLQKLNADLAAEARLAPEPIMPPELTKPLKLPVPQTQSPQEPPTWERYKDSKPIKGAGARGPGTLSKALGVVGTVASVVAMFSDDRLKYDITRVGTSPEGIPKYTFRYRMDGKHGPKYIGTSAQDLLSMGREDAVGQKEKDGFYYVDYSKLDVDMEVVTT